MTLSQACCPLFEWTNEPRLLLAVRISQIWLVEMGLHWLLSVFDRFLLTGGQVACTEVGAFTPCSSHQGS